MTTKDFWEQFLISEAFLCEELTRADSYSSPVTNQFVLALQEYSEGLGFVHYKDQKTDKHVLVISASGDDTYFLAATHLVAQAPKLANWEIHALVPPLSTYSEDYLNQEIELDGISIKIKHVKGAVTCFMDDDKTFGLSFLLPFIFQKCDQDKICDDLGLFVEEALGERRCSERICYIDIEYQKKEFFDYITIDLLDDWMKEFDSE